MLSLFYKLFGVKFNGDNLVYDRFVWLKRNLPKTLDGLKLLDIGCGNGWSLYLGHSKGFKPTGLTFDQSQIESINKKNKIFKADLTLINENLDYIESLDTKKYDVIINTENIEHVVNDTELVSKMSNVLNDRGFIYFTTPNWFAKPASKHDLGPFDIDRQDGGHVRRGYTLAWLEELFLSNNLITVDKGYLSGPAAILLLGFSRSIPEILKPLFKVITIPLSIFCNFVDRILFKSYKSSASVYFILQKRPIG
jgi:2-polyprenyl-3-methyl-5-hydroxy-6-metoxy-1,4-benzoquinol methylase